MTAPASIYPRTVDDLLPLARELAAKLGELPSRNRLMAEYRIGAPKAGELRDALSLPTDPDVQPEPAAPLDAAETPAEPLVAVDGHPDTDTAPTAPRKRTPVRSWPLILIALPAAVATWSGWVGLGSMTGFGPVNLLPGIGEGLTVNTAITLPIGVEAYAAYALRAWLSGSRVPRQARKFAKWSAIASLLVGSMGQIAYHLLEATGHSSAPWQVTVLVSCLPVAVLGMGAALAHLLNLDEDEEE